jgi:hypothetical protein
LVLVGGALKPFPTAVRLGRGQVGVQHLMRKFISLAVKSRNQSRIQPQKGHHRVGCGQAG